MHKSLTRGLVVSVALLAVMAAGATTAHARINPAGGRISATSRNSTFTSAVIIRLTCPTSEFTGTIAADGLSISGTLRFSSDSRTPPVTCRDNITGQSIRAEDCRITLRSTASTAGRSATGDVLIDGNPAGGPCSVELLSSRCTVDIGSQTVRNGGTFDQASQTLRANATVTTTNRSGTGPCNRITSATFTGDYVVTSGGPVTIS